MTEVELRAINKEDVEERERFIRDNQEAFRYGALEEFGLRDEQFEEDGEIISRETIEGSIDGENAETYWIVSERGIVGGVVISIAKEERRGDLELLFVSPRDHSRGIGYVAWCKIEAMHPEVELWETMTPYFEKRNIHFYVNRCGFRIVEFFNERHPMEGHEGGPEAMFRFEKEMVKRGERRR